MTHFSLFVGHDSSPLCMLHVCMLCSLCSFSGLPLFGFACLERPLSHQPGHNPVSVGQSLSPLSGVVKWSLFLLHLCLNNDNRHVCICFAFHPCLSVPRTHFPFSCGLACHSSQSLHAPFAQPHAFILPFRHLSPWLGLWGRQANILQCLIFSTSCSSLAHSSALISLAHQPPWPFTCAWPCLMSWPSWQ